MITNIIRRQTNENNINLNFYRVIKFFIKTKTEVVFLIFIIIYKFSLKKQ